MNKILGSIGIIAGIALGIYVGFYLCLVGGIVGLVVAGKVLAVTGTVKTGLISLSLLKILLSSFAGWVSAYALIIPSWFLLHKE